VQIFEKSFQGRKSSPRRGAEGEGKRVLKVFLDFPPRWTPVSKLEKNRFYVEQSGFQTIFSKTSRFAQKQTEPNYFGCYTKRRCSRQSDLALIVSAQKRMKITAAN
jgi:hypothetical protein